MTRTKNSLLAGCLFGLVAYAANAWTQESQQPDVSTRRREASKSDTTRALPRAGGVTIESPPVLDYRARAGHLAGFLSTGIESAGPMRQRIVSRTINETVLEPVPPEELEEFQAFQKAKQTLKDAKDDAEKQKAIETIHRHLDKQFERDLAQRERDLTAIEERVKSLRQQLSKRQVAKNEIISLRLKTIVNSAEGLDFPGDDDPQERLLGTGFGHQLPSGAHGALRATMPGLPGRPAGDLDPRRSSGGQPGLPPK